MRLGGALHPLILREIIRTRVLFMPRARFVGWTRRSNLTPQVFPWYYYQCFIMPHCNIIIETWLIARINRTVYDY